MLDERSLADRIAWIIAQPKKPLGVRGMVDWVKGNNQGEERLAWPLQVGTEAPPDVSFVIDAYPHGRPQRWHISLLICSRVMGLDYDPEQGHTNSLRRIMGDDLPYMVSGPHIHYWSDNRRFCTANGLPKKLYLAKPLPPQVRGFYNSVRWFCDEAHIEFPSAIALDLPPREQLL